jgi:hypothetical protein
MRVTIAYDRDLSKVGTTREVDDEEGARLIREGRAIPAAASEKPERPERRTAAPRGAMPRPDVD